MLNSRVGGRLYRYPKIVVNMTDEDVINRVSDMFGNSTYVMPKSRKHPDRKQQWRAQISGASAAQWMQLLHPWLGARRRSKIDEVLKEYGEIEPTGVRRSRSCSESAKQRWALHGTRTGKLHPQK